MNYIRQTMHDEIFTRQRDNNLYFLQKVSSAVTVNNSQLNLNLILIESVSKI